MATTNAAKVEFEALLSILAKTTGDAEETLKNNLQDTLQITGHVNLLEMLIDEVDKFKPLNKSKEREIMYDFTDAIVPLLNARMVLTQLKTHLSAKKQQSPVNDGHRSNAQYQVYQKSY